MSMCLCVCLSWARHGFLVLLNVSFTRPKPWSRKQRWICQIQVQVHQTVFLFIQVWTAPFCCWRDTSCMEQRMLTYKVTGLWPHTWLCERERSHNGCYPNFSLCVKPVSSLTLFHTGVPSLSLRWRAFCQGPFYPQVSIPNREPIKSWNLPRLNQIHPHNLCGWSCHVSHVTPFEPTTKFFPFQKGELVVPSVQSHHGRCSKIGGDTQTSHLRSMESNRCLVNRCRIPAPICIPTQRVRLSTVLLFYWTPCYCKRLLSLLLSNWIYPGPSGPTVNTLTQLKLTQLKLRLLMHGHT